MASFTWVGKNPDDFGGWAERRIESAVDALKREVDDAVDEGKDLTKRNLDLATTKTGESGRPSNRNSAGRNVTGDMIDQVTSGARQEGDVYLGYFGWLDASPKIFAQELGSSIAGVPAANSLRDSFFEEQSKAANRMKRIWSSQG